MKLFFRKCLRPFHGHDRGSSAVTFILAFPILLLILGILVQYVLLINAHLTLDRALAAAARSAMTSLPTDPAGDSIHGPDNVRRTATLALEPLSPAAPNSSPEADTVADSLAQLGVPVPSTFATRYAYAQSATSVEIDPIDANGNIVGAGINYASAAGGRARITVRYDFRLTVPLFGTMIGRLDTIGGLAGRYQTLSSTIDVQLSDGREVATNGSGEP